MLPRTAKMGPVELLASASDDFARDDKGNSPQK
jgi:hypothetical protein